MGEGARAFWGHATPDAAALDIAYQIAPTLEGPPSPRRGLPALKLFEHIRSPEIPYYLGWLNYWSAPAAQAIGFPDPTRDAELLSRAWRTASGGWLVQLTDTPLDLDNPAHLDALLRAYERFPEIGGRAAP
ncbi:Immunity protein 52 domain-containing protein [Corallococcus soli]